MIKCAQSRHRFRIECLYMVYAAGFYSIYIYTTVIILFKCIAFVKRSIETLSLCCALERLLRSRKNEEVKRAYRILFLVFIFARKHTHFVEDDLWIFCILVSARFISFVLVGTFWTKFWINLFFHLFQERISFSLVFFLVPHLIKGDEIIFCLLRSAKAVIWRKI